MSIIALHHAGIPVYDLDRARTFYTEVLGIPISKTPSYNPASIAFLDLGDGMVHLIRYPDSVQRPGRKGVHWAFETDDVARAFKRVTDAGCEIETPVSLRPDGTPYFFFYDPEGNRIEICKH